VHGVRVNIVAPGPADTEPGLPGAAVPGVRHLRLADHDRVSRLDPLHRRVVVTGDEIGVAV
jgi:NAD(P)-dependent dehydrogenase (short-subunit alcohol dehydrogenase family)